LLIVATGKGATAMAFSYYRLVRLLPIAFAAHIAEELLCRFPRYAHAITGHPMPLPLFLGSNIAFIAIMALLARRAARARTPAANVWLLAWSAGNQFWNFVFHLLLVVGYDRHSPGLVTGALIYLPLSLFLWQAALTEKVVRPAALGGAIALGGAWMAAVAAFAIFHLGGV